MTLGSSGKSPPPDGRRRHPIVGDDCVLGTFEGTRLYDLGEGVICHVTCVCVCVMCTQTQASTNKFTHAFFHSFSGAGAKVLGAVTLGDNVVVGANSVVTKVRKRFASLCFPSFLLSLLSVHGVGGGGGQMSAH